MNKKSPKQADAKQTSLLERLPEIIEVMAEVGGGDLDKQVKVTSSGVMGELELAFNEMITNLRHSGEAARELALENARLSELRNVELETIAKVSDLAAKVLEPALFLQQAIDLIKEKFGLYHAHTYLLDETGEILDLAVGTGEVGRQLAAEKWYIPLEREQSLVAQAARSRQGVIVNDVRKSPNFMPNKLLPDTRSEMAVPMVAGEQLLGVLDVQSDVTDRFGDEDIRVYTMLAAQIAVALQNANLYEEARERAGQLEWLSLIETTLSQATNEEEILTAITFAVDLDQLTCKATLEYIDTDGEGNPTTAYPVAIWDDGLIQTDDPTLYSRYHLDSQPIAKLWLESPGQALFVSDLQSDSRADEGIRQQARKLGIQTMAVLPLYSGGQWQGAVIITWTEPHSFSPNEYSYLRGLVETAAATVSTRRAQVAQQESSSFLDSVIESLPVALFIKDAGELKFVRWNKASEALFGFNREMMIGKSDYDFFPEEEADFFTEKDRQVLIDGEPLDIPEETIHTPHQGVRFLHTRKVPIPGQDGKPKYLLALSEDITERKQAEEAHQRLTAELENEHSTLRAIVENIPAGVFVAEVPSGKPLLTNKRAEEMLGRGISPDVETDGLAEVYAVYRYGTDQLYPQAEMPLVRGMSGDISSVDDMEIRRPDGRNILVQVFGSPIVDASGQIIASVAIFQDVTERKRIEESLRENETRLSEALELARLAYWEFDVETQMFTFNDQIYALYGTTAEQEGGYQISAEEFVRRFVHPDGAENAGLQIQRAIKTADPNYMAQFEDRIIRRDGEQIYIIVQLRILKDEAGRTVKLYGTNQDVTDRKQAEFMLNERVKELNCLNDIGREMEQSPSILNLLQWTTERIPPAMQYPDLAVAAIEYEGQIYGLAKAVQLPAQMTHGLYVGGEVVGRVYIAYTEKRDFLNEESALLGGIATRLSGYIENRRLFEQVQRRAEREQLVNTISQRIQSKMTMESALQAAVEELGRAFQARYTRVELKPVAKTDGNGKRSNGTKVAGAKR